MAVPVVCRTDVKADALCWSNEMVLFSPTFIQDGEHISRAKVMQQKTCTTTSVLLNRRCPRRLNIDPPEVSFRLQHEGSKS